MTDVVNIGTLDSSSGEWDEDGFHLTLTGDEQTAQVRVTDVETARQLIAQVKWLQSWIDEHDLELAGYSIASPEEREATILGVVIEHSTDAEAERLRDAADTARKQAKGE